MYTKGIEMQKVSKCAQVQSISIVRAPREFPIQIFLSFHYSFDWPWPIPTCSQNLCMCDVPVTSTCEMLQVRCEVSWASSSLNIGCCSSEKLEEKYSGGTPKCAWQVYSEVFMSCYWVSVVFQFCFPNIWGSLTMQWRCINTAWRLG